MWIVTCLLLAAACLALLTFFAQQSRATFPVLPYIGEGIEVACSPIPTERIPLSAGKLFLKPATDGQVCVLMGGNNKVLGRSYDGSAWESLLNKEIGFTCKEDNTCAVEIPNGGHFSLHTYGDTPEESAFRRDLASKKKVKKNKYPERTVSRFLLQTTFGPTREELVNFKGTFKAWIKEQMKLPPTLLRSYFRKRANARIDRISYNGRGRRACENGSRWTRFAFNEKDKGNILTTKTEGTVTTLSLDGIALTRVVAEDWAEAVAFSPLTVCDVIDAPDGVLIMGNEGCASTVELTNPLLSLQTYEIPEDRLFQLPDGARLIEMHSPVSGVKVMKSLQVVDGAGCKEPETGPYFSFDHDGNLYRHDSRLVLLDNTLESPATGYNLHNCPNVPKTFLNIDSCIVGIKGCSPTRFNSAPFALNDEAILKLQSIDGVYVYRIDGLRMDNVGTPCETGSSRWRFISSTCSSTLTGATLDVFVQQLDSQSGNLREVRLTEADSCTATAGSYVMASDGCFVHVHPDTGNVYDFSSWAVSGDVGHPGNAVAFSLGKPNPITLPSRTGQHTLMYPSHHTMSRWEDHSKEFPLLGVTNQNIDFQLLPTNLQSEAAAKLFGATVNTEVDDITEVCGSPGEVGNDPFLGNRYAIAQKHPYDVQRPTLNSVDYRMMAHHKFGSVWTSVGLHAPDQLRHRVAFALSEILVLSGAEVVGFDVETYLNFHDIFVRNAFGNYRDVLREVTYNPLMAVMLTYEDNKSLQYNLNRRKEAYPDENYAREVMQLFTIGLKELNTDGTVRKKKGKPIETYTNANVMDFARIFTGFSRQLSRANIEATSTLNPFNKMDPMRIRSEFRDMFPKMNLYGGFIGDGYPLCSSLPYDMFLRKGATYWYIGATPVPERGDPEPTWANDAGAVRLELSEDSRLYVQLCGSSTARCSYQSQVVLNKNLKCTGVECTTQSPTLIKVGKAYYEYVPPPCVQTAVFEEGATVTKWIRNAGSSLCANKAEETASPACCEGASLIAKRSCALFSDKIKYQAAETRCLNEGRRMCDYRWVASECTHHEYFWTNLECSVNIHVRKDGYVSLVHNTTDDNTRKDLAEGNLNFFQVPWDGKIPTVANNCLGICEASGSICKCGIHVKDSAVFKKLPTREKVLKKLHIGSLGPGVLGGYKKVKSASNGVKAYSRKKSAPFAKDSILAVKAMGKTRFFRNMISMVVSAVDGRPLFRNPVGFMKLPKANVRDATYEVEALLDHLIYHKNTPTFISYRMIQRFVTSNPSPNYLKVVSKAFSTGKHKGFGSGKYGDLGAMMAAILLEKEARKLSLDYDPAHGQLREPLLKYMHMLRSLEVSTPGNREIETNLLTLKIAQEPNRAPSVFSFFRPEYSPPGVISEAGLVAPEAQIITSPTIVGFLNGMISAAKFDLSKCWGGLFVTYEATSCGKFVKDPTYAYEQAHAHLDWMPVVKNFTAADVVDELDMLLTSGRLEGAARDLIMDEYDRDFRKNGWASAVRKAKQLVLLSPEFQITNHVQRRIGLQRKPIVAREPSRPYKAIVYLYIGGGLDSHNVLVPHSNCGEKDMFAEYESVREDIALAKNRLLPIDVPAKNQVCDTFGIHEELSIVRDLYEDEDGLFLANLGVMVEPITKEEYLSGAKAAPERLFAHNVQTQATQTLNPLERDTVGVLGRANDALWNEDYSTGAFSISFKHTTLNPSGSASPDQLVIGSHGVTSFNPSVWGEEADTVNNVIRALSKDVSVSVFAETWGVLFEDTLNQTEKLQTIMAANKADDFETAPVGTLSKQLQQVTTLIKSRSDLKMDRQAFQVQISGLDTHSAHEVRVTEKLKEINSALTDFVAAMKNEGVWEDVTIVQASEFARTISSNGAGTDHGWGGNYMVLGGATKGKQILGKYPSDLTTNGPEYIGRGRFVPTTSWESIWNAVLQWYGVPDRDLDEVLPFRKNFLDRLFTQADMFQA